MSTQTYAHQKSGVAAIKAILTAPVSKPHSAKGNGNAVGNATYTTSFKSKKGYESQVKYELLISIPFQTVLVTPENPNGVIMKDALHIYNAPPFRGAPMLAYGFNGSQRLKRTSRNAFLNLALAMNSPVAAPILEAASSPRTTVTVEESDE